MTERVTFKAFKRHKNSTNDENKWKERELKKVLERPKIVEKIQRKLRERVVL